MQSARSLDMPASKVWELCAEYDPERRVVTLGLYQRRPETFERAKDPVATAAVGMGQGYNVALRMARRRLLEKAGLTEEQVLGA